MNFAGAFSGKLIRRDPSQQEPVQRGPLVHGKVPDPVDQLVKKSVGSFPYEANGLVQLDPQKIEYLKS
jgi:hypothetical protein